MKKIEKNKKYYILKRAKIIKKLKSNNEALFINNYINEKVEKGEELDKDIFFHNYQKTLSKGEIKNYENLIKFYEEKIEKMTNEEIKNKDNEILNLKKEIEKLEKYLKLHHESN